MRHIGFPAYTRLWTTHEEQLVVFVVMQNLALRQCSIYPFGALTLLVVRQEGHPACKKTEWWGAGVVICLERGADLHIA